jgi:hypothetical protein
MLSSTSPHQNPVVAGVNVSAGSRIPATTAQGLGGSRHSIYSLSSNGSESPYPRTTDSPFSAQSKTSRSHSHCRTASQKNSKDTNSGCGRLSIASSNRLSLSSCGGESVVSDCTEFDALEILPSEVRRIDATGDPQPEEQSPPVRTTKSSPANTHSNSATAEPFKSVGSAKSFVSRASVPANPSVELRKPVIIHPFRPRSRSAPQVAVAFSSTVEYSNSPPLSPVESFNLSPLQSALSSLELDVGSRLRLLQESSTEGRKNENAANHMRHGGGASDCKKKRICDSPQNSPVETSNLSNGHRMAEDENNLCTGDDNENSFRGSPAAENENINNSRNENGAERLPMLLGGNGAREQHGK